MTVTDADDTTPGWTDAELRACVVAYRELQRDEAAGIRINKTTMRDAVVAASLSSRSGAAYEFRMANISSVLLELGLPILLGYQPRSNVGTRITSRLLPIINEIWGRQDALEGPTSDPDHLETRVASARLKIKDAPGLPPPAGTTGVVQIEVTTRRFVRDPNVVAWVLEFAKGICEVCDQPAPFMRADGEPYLEAHHVRFLSEGGPDSADNVVAACPTCHRRLHHGVDAERYRRAVLKKVRRLVNRSRKETEVAALPPPVM